MKCSGVIEILAYLSLLIFYRIYTVYERFCVGVLGVLAMVLANAFRITVICLMIHFGGIGTYYVAHTFVGRLVFYAFSIMIYFYHAVFKMSAVNIADPARKTCQQSYDPRQRLCAKNHLTYVKAGRTEIVLTYPWLGAGIAVSLADSWHGSVTPPLLCPG